MTTQLLSVRLKGLNSWEYIQEVWQDWLGEIMINNEINDYGIDF